MRVSIVIPTYRRPKFLRRLLSSIQKQTFQTFEVIVVDDASPQKEAYQEVITQFDLMFSSLNYLRNTKNLGGPYCRNWGITAAKGDLIALVDDDDEWLPEKLEKQLAVFENGNAQLGLVYTWTKVIKNDQLILEYTSDYEGNALAQLLLECFIPSPSVMVKKDAIWKAGLFDVHMVSCQDWDMWTRILQWGYTCAVVKSFEAIYHKHDQCTIGMSSDATRGYELYYKKHLNLYWKYHKRIYMREKIKPMWASIKKRILQHHA